MTLSFLVISYSSPAPEWAPELGVACPALSLGYCGWGESPLFPGNPFIPQTLLGPSHMEGLSGGLLGGMAGMTYRSQPQKPASVVRLATLREEYPQAKG